jgi:hypothetical protein
MRPTVHGLSRARVCPRLHGFDTSPVRVPRRASPGGHSFKFQAGPKPARVAGPAYGPLTMPDPNRAGHRPNPLRRGHLMPRTPAAGASRPGTPQTSDATAPTGRQTASDLAFLARAMKAPTLLDAAERLAERARAESWTYTEYLVACLQREVSARDSHGGEGRIRAARFPAVKTLEELDVAHHRNHDRRPGSRLATGADLNAHRAVAPSAGSTAIARTRASRSRPGAVRCRPGPTGTRQGRRGPAAGTIELRMRGLAPGVRDLGIVARSRVTGGRGIRYSVR